MTMPRHDPTWLNDELARAQLVVRESHLLFREVDGSQNRVGNAFGLCFATRAEAGTDPVGWAFSRTRGGGEGRTCDQGGRAKPTPDHLDSLRSVHVDVSSVPLRSDGGTPVGQRDAVTAMVGQATVDWKCRMDLTSIAKNYRDPEREELIF